MERAGKARSANMQEVVHRVENEEVVLKIVRDEYPVNPREWDNLGTMVCFHRRYDLGDPHDFETPGEFLERVTERDAIILPLYLYDHSGITMSTVPFHCPWDSGQVGWIYVLKEDVRKEWGVKRITPKLRKKVEDILRSEVETYDQYLQGDVYGFTLHNKCKSCGNEFELIDSCWGFYGDDIQERIAEVIPSEYRELVAL
jgi:hypothetical protein